VGSSRFNTVCSVGESELLVLDALRFKDVMNEFPEIKNELMEIA